MRSEQSIQRDRTLNVLRMFRPNCAAVKMYDIHNELFAEAFALYTPEQKQKWTQWLKKQERNNA